MNTTNKGNEFENLVFQVLEKTHPKSIEFYRGGSDRGRDIVVNYECNGLTQTVVVECKSYNASVKQKDIVNSINWAVSTKPDLFYIWTDNYITPSTKDYMLSIARQYKLNIAWEEGESVKKYFEAQNNEDLLVSLRKRIFDLLNIDRLSKQLEYTSRILPSNHTLINRKHEKGRLSDDSFHCFYLVGPSCVGKTQLAKNIAKQLYDEGTFIFWHRMISQNSESQLKNLLDALGTFFACVLKVKDLNEYLSNHGNYLTSSLLSIIKVTLSNHRCAIFIDDVHKCASDNHQYIELLMQLIDIINCRVYFIGWFNIFDIYNYRINSVIEFVDVTPLSTQHIREIALQNDSDLSESELEEIVKRSDGLPGLAEIIHVNKNDYKFEGLLSYFRSLLTILSNKEKAILFSLAASRVPLSICDLERIGYRKECDMLSQKRLATIEGDTIVLHDMYKEYVTKLLYSMPDETCDVLECCAKNSPIIYIDILYLLCKTNQIDRHDNMLRQQFDSLLNMGYDTMLLGVLQEREKVNGNNALSILMKKMILLERKSEYDILETYISITKDIIDRSNENYFMWNYIHMRYKYFKCDYIGILNDFYDNIITYQEYPIDLYLQILFIVGRTYYVMGQMQIAAEIYYYIFNMAMRKNLIKLATKAIHRLCIIEEKLCLYKEAQHSLSKLIDSRYFVSAKRQSFAYYRLSKCALGNGDIDAAIAFNEKSVDIKKSLNSNRGLVFSYKLYSQIYYRKNDIPGALYWSEEALKLARKLDIKKEIVSVGLVYVNALLAAGQNEEAIKILESCIKESTNLCLSYRLKSAIDLCNQYGITALLDISTLAFSSSEDSISRMRESYIIHFQENVRKNIDFAKIDKLFQNQEALSPLLVSIV